MMKRLALIAMLMLCACSPVHSVYYMVPELELADGTIPQTNTFPFASLQECLDQGHEFDVDMSKSDNVVAHSWDCVRSHMQLQKPVQPAVETKKEGNI